MKKHFISLIFSLLLVLPSVLFAQSDNLVKGKRGGYIVGGEQQVFFEIVDNGGKISFYPCDRNGEILKVVPTSADIMVAYIESTQQYYQKEVKLMDGAFSVNPPRDYAVFLYGINYTFNDQPCAVKFRAPGAPTPR